MEFTESRSAHAEVAILGACLLESNAITDALEMLSVGDFELDSHRKIFRAILELSETGNPVDFITVRDELARLRQLDDVGGPAYLAFVSEGLPRNLNIVAYCKIVKSASVLRQLRSLGSTLELRAADQGESPEDILADVEEQILELSQSQTMQSFETLLDAVAAVGGIDEYVAKMCDPAEMTGLSWGFKDVDVMLGGFQASELTIIAARPAMGKTALLINIAQNVVLDDADAVVPIFSLEMAKDSLYKRVIASLAEVSTRRAQAGFASEEEKRRMAAALIRIADRHLLIDDSSTMTTMQMRAKCRRLKQKMGRLDLVGIDYLQLMRGVGKHGSRQEEIASVSRGLKALAKELQVPVVALAQVGRSSEQRGDKRPMLSDLRESGAIEADADVVAFIHRAEYYAAEDDPDVEKGTAEIIIAKQRAGATGTVKLAYRAAVTKFSSLHIERGTPNGNGNAY